MLSDLLGLGEDDLAALSSLDALTVVRAWERVLGAATVGQARALRAVAQTIEGERGPGRGTLLLDSEIAAEVGLALTVSSATAGAKVGFAEALGDLGCVAAALEDGRMTVAHARVLTEVLAPSCAPLPDDVRALLERELVDAATRERLTPGQLRRRAHKRVLSLDAEGARRRRERARRGRDVSCRPDEHGMAWLSAYLPADIAQTCFGVLDGIARSTEGHDPDDERGIGARRADCLVDRLLTGHFDGDPPADAAAPIRPTVTVNVTVPFASLAGLDDEPGELDGHGPIDAAFARYLATSETATWRRLLTEPVSGTVLDVGTATYRPPAALDRHVRLRDGLCRWPGCLVPAQRCDLDHTVPHPDGPTSADNLVALCRRHHRLKTFCDVRTAQDDRTWTLTTPAGQTFTSTAPAHVRPPITIVPWVLQR